MSETHFGPLPEDNELEEAEVAKLRIDLGLRQTRFRLSVNDVEDACLDDGRCPDWCMNGEVGFSHNVEPEHPYEASHYIGVDPEVGLTLYPGEHVEYSDSHVTVRAAGLRTYLTQVGSRPPTITARMFASEEAKATLATEGLRLAVDDAKDLIKALSYVVDLAEGRRRPTDAGERR